jgi:hypothetical protein
MNANTETLGQDAHHVKVEITINNKQYKTHSGNNSVEHIRHLGAISADEILAELINGQFVDLDNHDHVQIHGGEVFASHVPNGGSS